MVLLQELLLNEHTSKSKQLSHSCTVTIICSFFVTRDTATVSKTVKLCFCSPTLFSVTSTAVEAQVTYERCSKFRLNSVAGPQLAVVTFWVYFLWSGWPTSSWDTCFHWWEPKHCLDWLCHCSTASVSSAGLILKYPNVVNRNVPMSTQIRELIWSEFGCRYRPPPYEHLKLICSLNIVSLHTEVSLFTWSRLGDQYHKRKKKHCFDLIF